MRNEAEIPVLVAEINDELARLHHIRKKSSCPVTSSNSSRNEKRPSRQ